MADSGPLLQAIGVDDGAGDIRTIIADDRLLALSRARYNLHAVPASARTTNMSDLRRYAWAGATSLLMAAALAIAASAQKNDKDKDRKTPPTPRGRSSR